METIIKIIVVIVFSFVVTFVFFWFLDPTFKDWWRNRPTWKDPDRWQRFKKGK